MRPKCITNVPLARDFGVEVGDEIKSHLGPVLVEPSAASIETNNRKNKKHQIGSSSCKKMKSLSTGNGSSGSSDGSGSSVMELQFSSSLSLDGTNAREGPSSRQ